MAAGFFGLNPEIEEGVRLAILQEYLDNIPDDMSDELDGLPDLDSDYEEEYAPRRAPRAAPDSPTGGYDCQFVGDLPDALQCLICTVAAKDPQQLDCCGKIFCKNCLDHLNMSANTSCPNCRDKKWKSFPDKKSNRDIKSLKVKCSNLDVSGCLWTGELRELDEHVTKCSGDLYPCKYSSIGCKMKKFKKDLPSHEAECTTDHLKLSMQKITSLEAEVKRLRGMGEKMANCQKKMNLPPVTFKFSNFVEQSKMMARENRAWESPPFYSHPCGYKFYLRLQFEAGSALSVSISVCLMKGEHDSDLEWPFRGTVKFEALNQLRDSDHRHGVARYMELRETQKNRRVPANLEKNVTGWGMPKFIFSGCPGYDELLSNGTLYVRIYSVQISDLNKRWLFEDLVA